VTADHESDREAALIRAAEAAASWARARRATWANAPPDLVEAEPPVPAPAAVVDLTSVDEPSPVPGFLFEDVGGRPSVGDRIGTIAHQIGEFTGRIGPLAARLATTARSIAESVRASGAWNVRWLTRGGIAVVLGLAAYVAIPRLMRAPSSTTRAPAAPSTAAPSTAAPSPAAVPAVAGRKGAGALRVNSTPAGARVVIDGKARGVTPVTVTDLNPGHHEVVLESDAGSVHRNVTIATNSTAELDESIYSGWLTVYAPFEITVAEGGRVLRTDERNQILLPPGFHELRLTNKALAYEAVRRVEVKPGETTGLRLAPDPSALTVTSPEAAVVWLDGVRVGETPLNAVPVPLGTHELIVRRTSGGERKFTVTIGIKPFTLNVDFR